MNVPMNTCLHGDALDMLRTLPDGCVQTCVTSPPYWGLRDYGTATWEGGREDCEHLGPPMRTKATINANCGTGADVKNADATDLMGQVCTDCGARRIDAQLGLEPTPEEYVARMVEVFREVRRVLRDDGTAWVNLGDSYTSAGGGGEARMEELHGERDTDFRRGTLLEGRSGKRAASTAGLKPKDLVGIPWRVAFALQADGWYLRQDIIWAKPNPMPESVTDRCTKAHEYVFLLAKSARYYWDAEAVAEPYAEKSFTTLNAPKGAGGAPADGSGLVASENWARDVSERKLTGVGGSDKRNRRSVWTVASAPYPDAHFATFPPALIEPCILAGAPVGGVVLDPFMGSGTTAEVAQRLGRKWLGIELNAEYIALQARRTAQQAFALE